MEYDSTNYLVYKAIAEENSWKEIWKVNLG